MTGHRHAAMQLVRRNPYSQCGGAPAVLFVMARRDRLPQRRLEFRQTVLGFSFGSRCLI